MNNYDAVCRLYDGLWRGGFE